MWIRIRIPNTDPDPESSWIRIQYGSGSTTLVKTVREFVFPLSVPTVRRPQPCLHSSSWLASISTHWGKSVFSMFKQKIFLNKFHYVCPSECCKQDLVFLFCPRCRYRYHTVHNIIRSYRSDVLQYFSFFKVKICFNFTSHICCFVLKYYIFLLQWHLQLPAEWRTPHPPGLPAWWG